MRKMWLLPIIGTIGNFFSVLMILLIPGAIIVMILAALLHISDSVAMYILMVVIFGYPVYLFYMGASGKGASKVEKIFGSRQFTQEEGEILMPLISEVLEKHNLVSGTNWQYGKDLDITIAENDNINAIAFGKTHVIFNTGLLNVSDQNVFKAILAHEIAHLHHKDTLIGLTNYYVQIPTQIVLNVFNSYKVAGHLKDGLKYAGRGGSKSFDKAWSGLFMKIYFSPALLVGSIVNFICNTIQKALSKQQEFAADTYAVKLGYADGLLTFFKSEQSSHVKPNRLMKLFESHPEPKLRIENVKAILEQSK
ncbi:MAG: M48 family metalloprotease [Burkholderiales bacterium]|nr:M48 family metalloprotease [Burkholderiales bacterium]